eukprot:s1699_g2.t1
MRFLPISIRCADEGWVCAGRESQPAGAFGAETCCQPLSAPELQTSEALTLAVEQLIAGHCHPPDRQRVAQAAADWLRSPSGRRSDGKPHSAALSEVLEAEASPCEAPPEPKVGSVHEAGELEHSRARASSAAALLGCACAARASDGRTGGTGAKGAAAPSRGVGRHANRLGRRRLQGPHPPSASVRPNEASGPKPGAAGAPKGARTDWRLKPAAAAASGSHLRKVRSECSSGCAYARRSATESGKRPL